MPFSTDDPNAQELLARNASFDLPQGAPNPLGIGPQQTMADAPKFQDPTIPFFQPGQAAQPGGIRKVLATMFAGMADAAMKESTGMNSVERQQAQLDIQQRQQQLRFGPMEMQAKINSMTAQPRFDPASGQFVGVMNDAQYQQYVRGQGAAKQNAASRETVAGITQAGANQRSAATNQNRIDVEQMRQQGPLQMAQARAANAHADLQDAMNDPDSPAFKLALQKVQWANYYKQAALEMQKSRLDFQQSGPTANIRTQGQMAGALQDHVTDIKGEIASLGSAGKLGPLQGRFNEFMAGKYGAGDPDYVALRTDLGLFQTALMKAHVGARGSEQIMAHFKGLIDSGKASPESLEAAMTTINKYLTSYVKAGQYTPSGGAAHGGRRVIDLTK